MMLGCRLFVLRHIQYVGLNYLLLLVGAVVRTLFSVEVQYCGLAIFDLNQ